MDKNCKIFQDLLPAYIDKLTSEETNAFMEEHLNSCEECKKAYEEMTADIEKDAVKNTEVIKTIKKYKRKIRNLKILIWTVVIAVILVILSWIGFRFYVVRNALVHNIDYDATGFNFRLEEYDESIERYKTHYTTFVGEGALKKVYGDKLLEYWNWELPEHYYIDEDTKTYYIVYEDFYQNIGLNIPICVIDGMDELVQNGKVKNFEVLKFILFTKDLKIQIEPFRSKPYFVIKNDKLNNKIYLDMDTFFAERVVNYGHSKEYRTLTSSVSWYDVSKPDLTGYTLVEK